MRDRDPSQLSPAIFGIHAVEELVSARPDQIDRIYFADDRRTEQLFALMKRCRALRLNYAQVPAQKLTLVAGTSKHQGVAALCAVKPYASIDEIEAGITASGQPALVVVPASVEDPRNLGALIRTCVALGAHGLVLERGHTAPLSAAAAKASAGLIEHALIARPRNLEGVVGAWKARGWQIAGAGMEGKRTPAQVDFTLPTVLVLGGEDRGIPPYLAKQCAPVVRIPMPGPAQSLNVSVAGAILLYECVRQRMGARGGPRAPSS